MGADAESITPQLLQLLRRVPVVLYIADVGPMAPWLYVSPQIEDLLGFTPAQWCRDPDRWARQLHPDDRARMLHEEAEAIAGRGEFGQAEYRLLSADGTPVWVSDDAKLVQTPDGLRWHGVLTDITDRRRVQEELLRRAEQQAAVARLGEHALEGKPPTELMQEALAAGAAILRMELAAVLEHQPGRRLEPRAGIGWPPPAGTVIRSKLSVAIDGRTGRYGVLTLQSRAERRVSDGDADFVQALANVLADALGRQAAEDEVRHRSTHDALSGLPNRTLFTDRVERGLARARRHSSLAAVLFLDLDHFKLVNDTLGHQVGDRLLAEAGRRIREAVRGVDTVARFGGDEFAVLLEDIDGEAAAVEIAERIGTAFAEPFRLAGQERFITASIGIAFARGGESPGEVIRDADAAMYRSKEQGRARWELFDEHDAGPCPLPGTSGERPPPRPGARAAGAPLPADRLPVRPSDRRGRGAAALAPPPARRPPTRDFVAIAEEKGMIEAIGQWVLEMACRQAVAWSRYMDRRPRRGWRSTSPRPAAQPRVSPGRRRRPAPNGAGARPPATRADGIDDRP